MLSLNDTKSLLSSAGISLLSGAILVSLSKCSVKNNNCENTEDCVFKKICPLNTITRGALITGILSVGLSNAIDVISIMR